MYEIPQQLEYKEKIVFGLTFTQLIYALIFFPIIFVIIFRIHASLPIRVTIAFFPFLLGCGFIFLNLSFHLKNWIIWFKSREVKTKEKMEKWFYIKEIKNSLIVTKNKKLAVLKVEPINFSIKPQGEQEAIILSFQKFLNSLDFPIQLLMTTETLNLEEYLNNLRNNLDESKVVSTRSRNSGLIKGFFYSVNRGILKSENWRNNCKTSQHIKLFVPNNLVKKVQKTVVMGNIQTKKKNIKFTTEEVCI